MLKNYALVSLRAMRRHPLYAAINVTGLAVGLASCLLIGLYVRSELSYDRFHDAHERIYRIVKQTEAGGGATTAGGYAALVSEAVGGVEATLRVAPWERTITAADPRTKEETAYAEPGFLYVDPSFLEVFSFRLEAGDPATALSAPGTAVLTRETARRYFGATDPIGRVVLMYDEFSQPNQIPLTVTGVLADADGPSHLPLSVLSSTATMEGQYGPLTKLDWPGLYTYVRLVEGADVGETARRATEALAARLEDAGTQAPELRLQAVSEIHLDPLAEGEIGPGGSKELVFGLAGMALLVLLLACTNFTNLALARASSRIKEVGVRQAVGAHRSQLAVQFMGESFLMTGLALALGLLLTVVGLPLVSVVTGSEVALLSGGWLIPVALLGLAVTTGVLAGGYPAVFISRQPATQSLRGLSGAPRGAARLRSGLVVFQFTASIALVALTLVVYRQLGHIRSLRLGFDREQIVTIPASGARRSYEPLREALLAQPGVLAVSAVNGLPGLQEIRTGMVIRREGGDEAGVPIHMQGLGPGFFEMMNVPFAAGRFPEAAGKGQPPPVTTEPGASPERPLIINGTAAAALGWTPAEAVGQRVEIVEPENEANNPGTVGVVTGVVKDFHHGTLRDGIPASAYYSAQSREVPGLYAISHVLVKLAPGRTAEQLRGLKAAWEQVLPDHPFEATFLDDQIQARYAADQRLGQGIGLFAGLAVTVACMGLFGLAALTAEQRTKEVGVRKVLGATMADVVLLLSKEYLKLVGAAFVLGAPAAYFVADRWLDQFVHRAPMGASVFLLAGLSALLIAMIAVSYQSLRAAAADPVRSLRQE